MNVHRTSLNTVHLFLSVFVYFFIFCSFWIFDFHYLCSFLCSLLNFIVRFLIVPVIILIKIWFEKIYRLNCRFLFTECSLNVQWTFSKRSLSIRCVRKVFIFWLFVHWMFTEFIDCSLNKQTLKWYVHFLFITFEWTNTCSLFLNEQNKMNKKWTHNEQIINILDTLLLNIRLFAILFIFCSVVVHFFWIHFDHFCSFSVHFLFIVCSFSVFFLFDFSVRFLFVWHVRLPCSFLNTFSFVFSSSLVHFLVCFFCSFSCFYLFVLRSLYIRYNFFIFVRLFVLFLFV